MPIRLDPRNTLSQALAALSQEPQHPGDQVHSLNGNLTLASIRQELNTKQRKALKEQLLTMMRNEMGPDAPEKAGTTRPRSTR